MEAAPASAGEGSQAEERLSLRVTLLGSAGCHAILDVLVEEGIGMGKWEISVSPLLNMLYS